MQTKPKRESLLQLEQSSSIKLLHAYFKDIDQWSFHWEISKADRKIGQALTEEFKKFLVYCIEKGRAKKTVKKHVGYLRVLDGELIRRINEDESERNLSPEKLILKHVDNSGGPYWRHAYNDLALKKWTRC